MRTYSITATIVGASLMLFSIVQGAALGAFFGGIILGHGAATLWMQSQ